MGISKRINSYIKKIVETKEINELVKNYKDTEKIIYLLTPEHGNLGDQAITMAIKKLLENIYNNKLILEFSCNFYMRNRKNLEKLISKNDTIILHGGGNLGSLYPGEEGRRRDVIKRFPNNKIIVMPQSITFKADIRGQEELKKVKKYILSI